MSFFSFSARVLRKLLLSSKNVFCLSETCILLSLILNLARFFFLLSISILFRVSWISQVSLLFLTFLSLNFSSFHLNAHTPPFLSVRFYFSSCNSKLFSVFNIPVKEWLNFDDAMPVVQFYFSSIVLLISFFGCIRARLSWQCVFYVHLRKIVFWYPETDVYKIYIYFDVPDLEHKPCETRDLLSTLPKRFTDQHSCLLINDIQTAMSDNSTSSSIRCY